MDSGVTLEMLNWVEQLVLENQTLKMILDAGDNPVLQWKRMYRDTMNHPASHAHIRRVFDRLRDELRAGQNPEVAIRSCLESLKGIRKTVKE